MAEAFLEIRLWKSLEGVRTNFSSKKPRVTEFPGYQDTSISLLLLEVKTMSFLCGINFIIRVVLL